MHIGFLPTLELNYQRFWNYSGIHITFVKKLIVRINYFIDVSCSFFETVQLQNKTFAKFYRGFKVNCSSWNDIENLLKKISSCLYLEQQCIMILKGTETCLQTAFYQLAGRLLNFVVTFIPEHKRERSSLGGLRWAKMLSPVCSHLQVRDHHVQT